MKDIHIDVESFSSVDLTKCGVYKYAQSEDFEILLFGYSVDNGNVKVVDLAKGEKIPDDIINALSDGSITKWAHNANFERVCLSEYLRRHYPNKFLSYSINEDTVGDYLDPSSWKCTMVWSAYMGLPFSLEDVGAVLGLDKQKLTEGKELIRYFCIPCKPTKSNNERTRNMPHHSPDKWELFKKYNKRDVEVEMQIQQKLSKFPVPDFVWEEYCLDQEINDRGIAVDVELAENAVKFDELIKTELMDTMQEITRLENPNSVQQMKEWLTENGLEIDSLDKKAVAELLKTAPPKLKKALEIRQQLAKSSVKKYQAMLTAACEDNRARGMFRFYGANRSGRESSRIIQIQNLPQNHMPDLAQAREIVRSGDYETMSMLYANIPDTLSQLIRTAFIPRKGYKFIVADFSAIEARVIAWLAGEKWVSEAFANNKDIYCETATRMFHVPVEKHGVNSELRQKGKQCTLSCSYGGSVGALKAMGALEMGIPEEELKPLVDAWREANPNIVNLWYEVDRAVIKTVQERVTTTVKCLKFTYKSGMLFITLPSGRELVYVKPRIGENRFGSESVTYEGIGSAKKWERIESYGAKFVENCLAKGTLVLTDCGLVPIEQVTSQMKIWDGIEWVKHDGLIFQGIKKTINVDGVRMTPEHKILTEKGWIEGGKAKGSNWKKVSLPDCYRTCGKYQTRQGSMVMPLCLRKNDYCTGKAFDCKKVSSKIVRLHETYITERGKQNTWNEPSSCVGSLAFNETEMYRPESSCISQLRRQRNNCLRKVDGELRKLLGRYGNYLEKRNGSRQDRQQQGVLSGELSLDNKKEKLPQQAKQSYCGYSVWKNDSSGIIGEVRNRSYNSLISNRTQVGDGISVDHSELEEYVYDIRNCGPRHRFTVWNGERLCIVSNCIQGIARDILFYAMKTLSHCFIVATVHDEMIIEADRRMSVEAVCEQMSRTPPWAEGLLLKAEGYECKFYKKS